MGAVSSCFSNPTTHTDPMNLSLINPFRLSRLTVPLWFFGFVPYKLGEALLITLLPLFIVQTVNGTVTDVGRVHSLTSLAGVIAFIVWGNLSDRLKLRRPFLILGFSGFALCTALTATAQGIEQVMIFSTLGAFLMAAITPVASALVIDSNPEDRWASAFGRFYQISGWSFVGGVLLGASWLAFLPIHLTSIGLRSLLLFASGAATVSLILCWKWVKEPRKSLEQRQYQAELHQFLSVAVIERRAMFYSSRMLYFILHPSWRVNFLQQISQPLVLYYACAAVFFFAVNVVFVPFPIFLSAHLGATNTQVLLISMSKAAIEAFFYLPMARFVQKHKGVQLQAGATAIRVGVFLIFTRVAVMPANSLSLPIVGIAHLLTGLTWAAISISSTTIVASLAPKGQEAMAMGSYNSLIGVATIIGSLVGGMMAVSYGYSACFVTGAVLMGLTAAQLLWIGKIPNRVLQK